MVWLESEDWCHPNYHDKVSNREDKIYIIHHTQEAHFYETEFQRIKNHWNLVNASAHWRKAKKPEQALELTSNPNLIREQRE